MTLRIYWQSRKIWPKNRNSLSTSSQVRMPPNRKKCIIIRNSTRFSNNKKLSSRRNNMVATWLASALNSVLQSLLLKCKSHPTMVSTGQFCTRTMTLPATLSWSKIFLWQLLVEREWLITLILRAIVIMMDKYRRERQWTWWKMASEIVSQNDSYWHQQVMWNLNNQKNRQILRESSPSSTKWSCSHFTQWFQTMMATKMFCSTNSLILLTL